MLLSRLRRRAIDEGGFTLIELLVVILIMGILAAIAIPTFLSQKSKATDASAKELVTNAETVAETYSTDHNGEYTGLSTTEIHNYEIAIPVTATTSEAYLSSVTVPASDEYTLTATATDGHTFTITRLGSGAVERTCTPTDKVGAEGGGCQDGSW